MSHAACAQQAASPLSVYLPRLRRQKGKARPSNQGLLSGRFATVNTNYMAWLCHNCRCYEIRLASYQYSVFHCSRRYIASCTEVASNTEKLELKANSDCWASDTGVRWIITRYVERSRNRKICNKIVELLRLCSVWFVMVLYTACENGPRS